MLETEFIDNWIYKFKKAWLNKDLAEIRDIFEYTENYYENPFVIPTNNIEEILSFWEEIKYQNIFELDFKVLLVHDLTLMLEWNLESEEGHLKGIYEIGFNGKKKCIYFRQWYMQE